MATFNSVDDEVLITLPQKGESAIFAVSGTYVQVIRVAKEVGSPGSGAWSIIKEFATDDETVSFSVTSDFDNQTFRAIVQTYTSGSVTATWTDASDAELYTLRDKFGNVLINFLQSVGLIPGSLQVQTNLTVDGTLTQTGNATLAGDIAVTGNATTTGTLTQTGKATLADDLQVDKNSVLTGTTLQTGIATFTEVPVFTAGISGTPLKKEVVAVTANQNVAASAAHANKLVTFNALAGFIYELPAATGSGDVYEFIVITTNTSVAYVIECTEGAAFFRGAINMQTDDSGIVSVPNGTTHDFINMNGTTTGGVLGGHLRIVDAAVDVWTVSGTLVCSGSEATPFAAS